MTARPPIVDAARMAVPDEPRLRIEMQTMPWPVTALVDEMLTRYVGWRESAEAVAHAYQRWCTAPADKEALTFSAYMAVLDSEQAAADLYSQSISDLEQSLRPRGH
jgi:hypothetical protein